MSDPRRTGTTLLDTDVLIDHLQGHRALELDELTVSVITQAELFAGNQREEPAIEALLTRLTTVDVDATIARVAGRIRRSTRLGLADALIAATAVEHQLPLMTRNRRHFERVPGLQLVA
ncbi:MAG TPA: type II toxin-antitoxin system VapC family toxin [Acidimicrobiales bacterium]|nr:type II toxin-antitoxin system VapC family toxin [Acidimicrobiales bacterium]